MSKHPSVIEVIGAELKARGLNWTRLGEVTGFSGNRFSRWKDGTGEPSFIQTVQMARAVGPPKTNSCSNCASWLSIGGISPTPIGLVRATQMIYLGERARAEGWTPSVEPARDLESDEQEKPRVAPNIAGTASHGSIRRPKAGGDRK